MKPFWLKNRYGKIRSNTECLHALLNTKNQVVYYFANLWTKHAYVGETNNKMGWQYRIQQEVRTAKKIYYSRHKTKQQVRRYADRIMGNMGFFTWCVMPIYTLNKDSTKQDRLQKEKEAIQRLQPTMNTKHTWGYKWDKTFLRKKNDRHQRWRRLRKSNIPTKYYKNTMATSTKFETKQKNGEWERVTSLSKLLMNTKSGEKLRIRKNKICAHNDWTNYTHAQEFHGDTIFSSTKGEHFTLKELGTSSLRKNQDDQYYVTVRKTKPMERWKEEIILKMKTHRNAKNKSLIKLTFQELYELYTSVDAYIQDEKGIRRVKELLNNYMARGWTDKKYNKPKDFNIRFIYDHRINETELKKWLTDMIAHTDLEANTINMIKTRIRTIPKNRNSIKQALKNNKDRTKRWINGVKPKCIKHEWCTGDEHYQIPMSMMDGPAGKLGRLNADTILNPGKGQMKRNVHTAVIDFMNTLRKIKGHTESHNYNNAGLRNTMQDLNIDKYSIDNLIRKLNVMQEKWKNSETQPTIRATTAEKLTNWDIQKAKRQLEGLIVTELDKNKAKLYVE